MAISLVLASLITPRQYLPKWMLISFRIFFRIEESARIRPRDRRSMKSPSETSRAKNNACQSFLSPEIRQILFIHIYFSSTPARTSKFLVQQTRLMRRHMRQLWLHIVRRNEHKLGQHMDLIKECCQTCEYLDFQTLAHWMQQTGCKASTWALANITYRQQRITWLHWVHRIRVWTCPLRWRKERSWRTVI